MEQKATVTLSTRHHELGKDGKEDSKRPLKQPLTTLVIVGELLPESPLIHHVLDALLDKENPPKVEVKFENTNNVLSYSVVFSHTKNVLAEAAEEHALTVEAGNREMKVEDLRKEKAQIAKLEADEKKANEKE